MEIRQERKQLVFSVRGRKVRIMKVELKPREKELLITELEHIIPELGGVIASGVRKDLRDEMKKERDMLRDILEKLKMAA